MTVYISKLPADAKAAGDPRPLQPQNGYGEIHLQKNKHSPDE